MFRNFKTVERIVFGRGCVDQLDTILSPQRSARRPAVAFLVDDVFMDHPLRDRLPLRDADLLIWVNVDDEPKTAYVDQLTLQVRPHAGQAGWPPVWSASVAAAPWTWPRPSPSC
jgi:3-deoxy-alpha-D-manno-octulosonate 8-oxidase